ncbi:MAG: transposase [Candidatus Margulisiibacteriota bacterium]
MEDKLKRKRIRLKDFNYATPRPYFITICSRDKTHFFVNDNLNQSIIKCLIEEKKRVGFKIYVYCLMPNHLHLLLAPSAKEISISEFIGAYKSKTTRIAWDYGISGKLWQWRFHDRVVRKSEDLQTIGQYILDNPVRKGLVLKWQDYKYLGLLDSWL